MSTFCRHRWTRWYLAIKYEKRYCTACEVVQWREPPTEGRDEG